MTLEGAQGATLPGGADGAAGDAAAAGVALPDEAEDRLISVARVEGQMRASALKELAEMVDNNPEQAVAVMRSWLAAEEGTA